MEPSEEIVEQIDKNITIPNKLYNQNKKKAIEFEKTNSNLTQMISINLSMA